MPSFPAIRSPRIVLALLLLVSTVGLTAFVAAMSVRQPPQDSLEKPMLMVTGEIRGGGQITVTGRGFSAGQLVTLAWNDERILSLDPIAVGADRTFVAEWSLPVDLDAGRHSITVSDADGLVVAVAHVVALLAAPSASPPAITTIDPPSEPELPIARATPHPSEPPTGEVAVAAEPAPAPSTAPPSTAPPGPTTQPPHPDSTAGAGEHGGTLGCSGYPEPRVWVESQDWWEPIPKLGGMGHMHMGMCFPVGQTVSGTVSFDARVVLHHNAGTLVRIKMQDDLSDEHIVLRPDRTVGDGVYWYTLNIDTTAMPDGLRLFRFYADLEHPNGNTQTARPIFPLRVENGTADRNWSDRDHELRATAWYREAQPELDWGYVGAVIENYSPGPFIGSATFEAKCFLNGENGGDANSSPQLASWSVHIDPDFHGGNEGLVIARGQGQLNSTITFATDGLEHGWHRLVVRCNQVLLERQHSAVGVFSMLVDH